MVKDEAIGPHVGLERVGWFGRTAGWPPSDNSSSADVRCDVLLECVTARQGVRAASK